VRIGENGVFAMTTPGHLEVSDGSRRYACWLVFLFAVVSLFGVLHHQMWRDELQAWLLAKDSSSLADLWRNTLTENHPLLWHTLLFCLTRITSNAVAMLWLHWVIAVASVWVFVRFSPFTMLQKTLFCFGYFPLFEYCEIARNYSLCMLLVFAFCALICRHPRNYAAIFCVIGLLSCAHYYDWPIICALIALLVFDCINDPAERENVRSPKRSVVAAISFLSLCLAVGVLHIWRYVQQRPAQNSIGLQLTGVQGAFTWMWRMFFPIPVMTRDTFGWNTNLWADTSQQRQVLAAILAGVLLILVLILLWWKSRRAFLLYLVGTALLLGTQMTIGVGALRHTGKHYVLLLASCWIAAEAVPWSRPSELSKTGEHLLSGLLTAILSAQLITGLVCYCYSIRCVFSAAKPTVQFLRDNHLDDKFIAVSPDESVTAISGYLGRIVYAADTRRMQSFLVCDATYYTHLNKPEDAVVNEMLGMLSNATNQIVLITRSRLLVPQGENFEPLVEWQVPLDKRIRRLTEFTETITDEKFCIYLLEKDLKD